MGKIINRTVRLPELLARRLSAFAERLERSEQWVIVKAIETFVESNPLPRAPRQPRAGITYAERPSPVARRGRNP